MSVEPPLRLAVCSDIHGNLPALRAFLDEADARGFDRIVCCGDVVGYGAQPNECCEILRRRAIPTVLGNHDQAAVYLTQIEYFNDVAREAIEWTHRALTPENRMYLKGLPLVIRDGDFTFVHASPCEPAEWNYVLTEGEARICFACFETWMCLIGHSHQPFVVEMRDRREISCPTDPEIALSRDKRYLVNVGSIGQPRDRTPLLCYATVDTGRMLLEFQRSLYPIAESQRAIVEAGLPAELSERLLHGW